MERTEKRVLTLDRYEHGVVINALNEIDNSATPSPGMIIFFDWNNKGSSGPQDGLSDHVGIVERVEDGIIYTIEGNSGDSCRENHYAVGHYEFLGYGVPAY